MCLSNFKAIRQFKVPISWIRNFTRSYERTSFWILRRGPGLWRWDKRMLWKLAKMRDKKNNKTTPKQSKKKKKTSSDEIAILNTTLLNSCPCVQILVFWNKFHSNLFPCVQFTGVQVTAWPRTNYGLVYWQMYASLGLNRLNDYRTTRGDRLIGVQLRPNCCEINMFKPNDQGSMKQN